MCQFQEGRVFSIGGFVCQYRKSPTPPVCEQMAPSSGLSSKRTGVRPAPLQGGICQPSMDLDPAMAFETETGSSLESFDGGSNVDWHSMVAPVGAPQDARFPCPQDETQVGLIHQLSGEGDATHQMAPSLCDAIKAGLQRKQVSPENIQNHLSHIKNLKTYDAAFKNCGCFVSGVVVTPSPCLWRKQPVGCCVLLRSSLTQPETHTVVFCSSQVGSF